MRRNKDLQRPDHGEEAHLVDVGDFTVDHFAFEGLHHNGSVETLEPCLTCRREDFALAYRRDLQDSDDVAGVTLFVPKDWWSTYPCFPLHVP